MLPRNIQVRDEQNPSVVWTVDLHNNTRSMRDDTGRLVTMDLGVADVHIDSALSNYAAGYKLADGIADAVCPVVPTAKTSDYFYTWDKDDVFQDAEDLVVGPGGSVKEISPRLSSATFSTLPFGIGSFVPTELAANADAPLAPEMAAVRRCLNAIRLGRERRVASLLMTSGSWSGGTVAAVAAKWNGGASSDPVADLHTAIESSLTDVTGIVMSERTMHDFARNPAVQKYIASKTKVAPMPGATEFAALLELPPILVGRMKGKTSSGYGYVWGDNVALIKADAGVPADGQSISTAKTFRWTGANAGVTDGTMQGGFLVRSYFDQRRGARGGRMVIVVHNDAEVMTSVYAGGLLTGAHA